jgi:hypothetical protein
MIGSVPGEDAAVAAEARKVDRHQRGDTLSPPRRPRVGPVGARFGHREAEERREARVTCRVTSPKNDRLTTLPCSLCFVTVTDQCLGPCASDIDCGGEPTSFA